MELCLISKETIENLIKLPCNHSFDYIYLYYEIIEQKKTLSKGFKCPYCRIYYDGNIPYYEINEVEKKKNINYKQCKTINILNCSICNEAGNKYTHGIYCIQHSKIKLKCKGICKNGNNCKNNALINLFCKIHTTKE